MEEPIFEAITINHFGIRQHLLIYESNFNDNYRLRLWNRNYTKCYANDLPCEKIVAALKINYRIKKIIISNKVFYN